jgi:hypothetical protein
MEIIPQPDFSHLQKFKEKQELLSLIRRRKEATYV